MASTLKAGDRVLYSVNGTLYNALVLGATEGHHSGTGSFGTHPTILTVVSELTEGKKTGFVVEPVTEIPLEDWKSADATQASINGYIESQVDGDDFPEPHMEVPAAT